jgi:transglutaminase-like putative cysteine protease
MVTRLLRAITVPLLLIGMLTLAGITADRVYSGNLLTLLTAGAAVGSVLISLVLSRLPAWLIAPISTAGLAGYLAMGLIYSAQQAGIPADLVPLATEALPSSIPRLLAALVPIEPQPDTIAVPVIATWLAGLASAELAIRARRMTVALVLPVLLFTGALWLVGPSSTPLLWPVLAFGALAVATLAITGRVRTPESGMDKSTRNALRLRTTAAAAAGVSLILVVAVAGGPFLSRQVSQRPLDPRSLIEPPSLDVLDENPLIRLSGWALQPTQKLFEADVAEESRIRLAVLSDYDGVTWKVGATYRPAGRTMPDIPSVAPREPVRQQIKIAELTGKLLPAIATPRQINGVRVAFDPLTGTVVRPEGLADGLTYTVTSQREKPNFNLLPGAEVPDASTMARYLALGAGIPEDMQALARKLGEGNGAAYPRAQAIETYLADHYRLDSQAPSGHAYPNLGFFLFDPVTHGGQKGTSEQFAAAYAVLARLLNLPSRVVVGFHAKAGRTDITAGDALAWPEVYFNDIGWVAFNPMPQSDQVPKPPEMEFKPQPDKSEPPPPSEVPIPTLAPTKPAIAETAAPEQSGSGVNVALVAGAGGGGLIFLLLATFVLIVLIGRSRLRRGRLDEGTPAHRVQGAWLEVSDALRLAGRPAQQHLTATELAGHAAVAAEPIRGKHRMRLAAPPIDELAGAVNNSSFAPGEPGPEQAEIARSQALTYIDELKARRSWWRRLLWTLHPGPLRWARKK